MINIETFHLKLDMDCTKRKHRGVFHAVYYTIILW